MVLNICLLLVPPRVRIKHTFITIVIPEIVSIMIVSLLNVTFTLVGTNR